MVELGPETKVMLWDLDGTLLNSFGIFTDLVTEVAPMFHLPPPSIETMAENFHGTLPESINNSLGNLLDEAHLAEFVKEFISNQTKHYLDVQTHILEDALDLSLRATKKGLKQVVVTNRDHAGRGPASPRSIVANTTLKDHIHEVFCGDDHAEGIRKPDAQVLGDALKRWDVHGHELVVIGDQYVDAQLAINLGARAIIRPDNGGAEMAHAHKLDEGWQQHVTVVSSFAEVTV